MYYVIAIAVVLILVFFMTGKSSKQPVNANINSNGNINSNTNYNSNSNKCESSRKNKKSVPRKELISDIINI